MLTKQLPAAVKFVCGIIYAEEKILLKTLHILRKKFGDIDFESQALDFNYTNYYQEEMGNNLKRKFISFKKLKDPSEFIKVKLFCLKIEKKFSIHNKRQINLDPGYLNEAKLVLTTSKDFSHRIYLSRAVYAEVTLLYENGDFKDLPSTFPDYRTKEYKAILKVIRNIYRKQIHL